MLFYFLFSDIEDDEILFVLPDELKFDEKVSF